MCGQYHLHGSRQMIEIIIEEVKSLLMFYQVEGKKLCDKGLKIVETNL